VVLAMIPVLLIQAALTVGLGIFLATINVFYRDVSQSIAVILQFWFWLTPVVYAPKILPPLINNILACNPIWPLIDAYHRIFLDHQMPVWNSLIYPSVLAAFLVLLGMVAFSKLQGEIVDEL
jgi:lipopolysaccharide transport system permease protein